MSSKSIPTLSSLPFVPISGGKVRLHAQVRNYLRDIILLHFDDGDRFYTERQIVNEWKVSQPTVRRALVDLAQEGILTRHVGSGTFVNKKVLQHFVGIIAPDFPSPYSGLSLVSQLSRDRGFGVHVYYIHAGEQADEVIGKIRCPPAQERIVLLENPAEISEQLFQRLSNLGYKSVTNGSYRDGFPGTMVDIDNRSGVQMAVNYLMSLGHRRIAFLINEPAGLGQIDARIQAISHSIKKLELTEAFVAFCDIELWQDSYDAAYKKTDEILGMSPLPTAIFAVSGAGACAALKRSLERTIRVPEQISIFSFDDGPLVARMHPSLSSLRFESGAIVDRVVELLWDDRTPPHTELFPPQLVIRESTSAPS